MDSKNTLFGVVPDDWTVKDIGAIFTLSQGLQISKNLRITTPEEGYIPLLKITDLPKKIFSEYVTNIDRQYLANKNNIIYTRTGNVGLVYTDVEGCVHNNCFQVHIDNEFFDKYYVYYYLKSPQVFEYSNQVASGSVQKDLTHPSFKSCIFGYPNKKKQQKIASILSSLDDKIELNTAMNQTLEAMAQTIFKSWFVDFEPFKEGEFIESELGMIPEEWEVKHLTDIAQNKASTHKFKKDDHVVFINTGDVLEGRFLHNNFSIVHDLPGQAKKLIEKNDILFSEIRPKNRRFAFVIDDMPKHVVSTKFMVIKAKKTVLPRYLYMLLTDKKIIQEINTIAEGRSGTFPQITFESIGLMKFIIPPLELQLQFFALIHEFDVMIHKNHNQIQTLTKLRDALLPKLMNGEVRV